MKNTKTFLKHLLVIILFITCLPLSSQVSSFDEMEIEPDSIRTPYKVSGKNYVFVRSKRGTSGVNKTASADAIINSEVNEIVLVFSELNSSAIEEREEANRERWENLLKTYPELFQFSTTYKNLCQCNNNGDSATFKKGQGFYIYVNGEVPKVAEEAKTEVAAAPATKTEEKKAPVEKKAEESHAPAKQVAEKSIAVADNTSVKPKEAAPVKEAPAKETPPVKEAPAKEAPVKETVKETVKEVETPAETPVQEEAAAPVRSSAKKAVTSAKPRRAKDTKACRPACYGYGDEDLNNFFKESIPLTKKQKRKAKNWVAQVKIQINHDGSIKKAFVTGSEPDFNQMVEGALKTMNNWNSAVKAGTAVKSEVRFTLKYDKDAKVMKPNDMIMNPRPTPKCQCVSDSEIFGD